MIGELVSHLLTPMEMLLISLRIIFGFLDQKLLREQLLSVCTYGVLQSIGIRCHICCGGTDRSMLWPAEAHLPCFLVCPCYRKGSIWWQNDQICPSVSVVSKLRPWQPGMLQHPQHCSLNNTNFHPYSVLAAFASTVLARRMSPERAGEPVSKTDLLNLK